MYDLVLLHKSTYVGLSKAQILMKHKKFFPTPLPKSSFEGMGSSFFACISLSISSFRITVYLHNDVFPDLGKEEIFLKGQNFFPIPPSIFPL